MNEDNASPNCGSKPITAEPIPVIIPPTIPPMKFPMAVPTSPNVTPPSASNSLKPGIFDNNPAAVITAAIIPMNAASPSAPSIAISEFIPLTIEHASDKASINIDIDIAVSIDGPISNKLISPRTTPTTESAIDIVTMALAAPAAFFPEKLAINIAVAKAFNSIPIAIALGIMLTGLGRRLIRLNVAAISAMTRVID